MKGIICIPADPSPSAKLGMPEITAVSVPVAGPTIRIPIGQIEVSTNEDNYNVGN